MYVVTDLDGTLLTSARGIAPETRAALAQARGADIVLAIATARPYRLVEAVVPPDVLALFSAVIVSNGAAIVDPESRRVLGETTVPAELAAAAMERLRAEWPTAGFGWESGEEFGSDARFIELRQTLAILRDPSPDRVRAVPSRPVHQLVFAVPGVGPRALLARAGELLGDELVATDSKGGVVEVSLAGATKAAGAEWWVASRGGTLAQVVAFGDELNDVSLLARAGIGIAMSNAPEAVKAVATRVARTNDEHGVAIELRKLVGAARG